MNFTVVIGLILATSVLFMTITSNSTAQSDSKFTKDHVAVCERLYKNYVKMTEPSFVKKYSFLHYVNECVKLYKDSIWKYAGKDREKIYSKYLDIKRTQELDGFVSGKPYIEILSKAKIGDTKYHLMLKICPDNRITSASKILVKSESSSQEIPLKKMSQSGICQPYRMIILAKDPGTISAMIRI